MNFEFKLLNVVKGGTAQFWNRFTPCLFSHRKSSERVFFLLLCQGCTIHYVLSNLGNSIELRHAYILSVFCELPVLHFHSGVRSELECVGRTYSPNNRVSNDHGHDHSLELKFSGGNGRLVDLVDHPSVLHIV